MTSYSYTTAYKSVLGMGLFETAQAAKLADLTEAARNLHESGPTDIVSQFRRREGPAFQSVKALAELIDDSDTLTDEARAKRDAEIEEWRAKHYSKGETKPETIAQAAE